MCDTGYVAVRFSYHNIWVNIDELLKRENTWLTAYSGKSLLLSS